MIRVFEAGPVVRIAELEDALKYIHCLRPLTYPPDSIWDAIVKKIEETGVIEHAKPD